MWNANAQARSTAPEPPENWKENDRCMPMLSMVVAPESWQRKQIMALLEYEYVY